jgi:hypothetical protein
MKESVSRDVRNPYVCGLGFPELVSLKISDLFFEEGLLNHRERK